MNLQDHLETHPKEKVIAALVNMTLLQQQTNDAEDTSNFQCSRYEPLTDDIEAVPKPPIISTTEIVQPRKQIAYYSPPEKQSPAASTTPTPRRVMIVNSRVSRIFQTPTTVSIHTTESRTPRSHIIPKTVSTTAPSRIIHLIAANVTTTSQSLSIPPPPPYDTAVPLLSTQPNTASSSYSITNAIEQCPKDSERDTSVSATASVRKKQPLTPSSVTNGGDTGDLDAERASRSNQSVSVACEDSKEESPTLISSGKASDVAVNCNEQYLELGNVEASCSIDPENMVIDETCSVIHMNDKYIKDEETTVTNMVHKRKVGERNKPGLKVLSDVKLSPNAALNVSTFNTELSEPINLDHMIVVGPSSKSMKKLLSKSRNEDIVRDVIDITKPGPSHENNVNLKKPEIKAKQTSKSPDPARDRPSTSRDRTNHSPPILETIDLSIDTKPCSSKATSVIRLASPNKSLHANEPPVPQPIAKSPMVKIPFNRPPKKLIVKLKRPFVPVIEEEANLHAPELPGEPLKAVIKQEGSSRNSCESEARPSFSKKTDGQILECSEDVPFSPLRQSYTPLPPLEEVEFEITELGDEAEMEEEELNQNGSASTSCDAYNNSDFVEDLVGMHGDIPQIVEDGEFDDRIAIVKVSSDGTIDEIDESWPSASTATQSRSKQTSSYTAIKPDRENIYNASTSMSSEPSSSSQNNFQHSGPSGRQAYGLPSFLGYNEQHEGEYFYSGVRLSPIGFANENNPWNQRFSPQYAPFEVDKNSAMDLDGCKNTCSGDRAPSTDSLNIHTDEKMPAKGEISEQESNGDGSWSHQV